MTDPKNPEANPYGRPSKFTAKFLAAAQEVINQDDNALIYADEELLFQINENLSPEARIAGRTSRSSNRPGSALVQAGSSSCRIR